MNPTSWSSEALLRVSRAPPHIELTPFIYFAPRVLFPLLLCSLVQARKADMHLNFPLLCVLKLEHYREENGSDYFCPMA